MAVEFSPSQLQIALTMLSMGKSLSDISKALALPPRTVAACSLRENASHLWAQAQAIGYEILADRLLSVHAEMTKDEAKIYSDNLKWLLSRRAVARYGDRLAVDVGVTVDIRGALDEALGRVKTIRHVETSPVRDIAYELELEAASVVSDSAPIDQADTRAFAELVE